MRLFLSVGWPILDTEYTVPFACPLFNPNPSTLHQLSFYPYTELHAFQLLSHIPTNSPSYLFFFYPKEPVSFHCNTPVMKDISPCLPDPVFLLLIEISQIDGRNCCRGSDLEELKCMWVKWGKISVNKMYLSISSLYRNLRCTFGHALKGLLKLEVHFISSNAVIISES